MRATWTSYESSLTARWANSGRPRSGNGGRVPERGRSVEPAVSRPTDCWSPASEAVPPTAGLAGDRLPYRPEEGWPVGNVVGKLGVGMLGFVVGKVGLVVGIDGLLCGYLPGSTVILTP